VRNAEVALQHNLGLGGCCVISLYKMGFPEATKLGSRIAASPTSAVDEKAFKASEMFSEIKSALDKDGANYVKKIKGIFCFKVKGPNSQEGVWIVDAKNGNGAVKFGSQDKADTTITINDEDLVKLMTGKLNPQTAFFQGKLKIAGNMALAMKLKEIQPAAKSKL